MSEAAIPLHVERVACEECGREFTSMQALNGHKRAHMGQEPCPECGETFSAGAGLGRHRQAIHGVVGKRNQGPPPKKRGRPPGVPNKPKAPDLSVDEIFQAVLNIMWPSGKVPTESVMALLRWRDATERMLEEIR